MLSDKCSRVKRRRMTQLITVTPLRLPDLSMATIVLKMKDEHLEHSLPVTKE